MANGQSVMNRMLLLLTVILMSACGSEEEPQAPSNRYVDPIASQEGIPLEKLTLPSGFNIMLYGWDIDNARSMSLAPSGWLFVGTRSEGKVYALRDSDGDNRIDQKFTLAENLRQPNGVAFKDGDLYIAEISEISVIRNVEQNISNNMPLESLYSNLPTDGHHGWKYITFGPDGKLYVPIGAPCNVCDEGDPYASICRINSDGTGFEIVQRGIRNTVGITFHPTTQDLWFTDNGRDWWGDDRPKCELNHATSDNLHFGFPYCHQGDLIDDEYGDGKSCNDYVSPAINLGPHVAPLGLEFYTGSSFPSAYNNKVLIAEHGSWNRSTPIGYRITQVEVDNNSNARNYSTFIEGWLESNGNVWGRPVDLEHLPDGSLLISDDYANAIYRVWYNQ